MLPSPAPSPSPFLLHGEPDIPAEMRRQLEDHYLRSHPPIDATTPDFIRHAYDIDLSTQYANLTISNPWGKASGQLSMTSKQVTEDTAAGLGFVVLKTVIAEDSSGTQSMKAWAIPESRMLVEPIQGQSGEMGWTVSWKGRGWSQSFADYLELVRDARRITADSATRIVPSCKFHLPSAGEGVWRQREYDDTMQRLLDAFWDGAPNADISEPMPIEKDFSPTLAGSDHAAAKTQIVEWLQRVPTLMRDGAGERPVSVGLKIFNALFDDNFQMDMLRLLHAESNARPDFYIYANRLFDPNWDFEGHRGIAVGGPDLSHRNLRIAARFQDELAQQEDARPLPWCATGDIHCGRMAMEYALRGATSFQLHTRFQIAVDPSHKRDGSKTQKTLHELYFHPQDGFIAWVLHCARRHGLPKPYRFADLTGANT